jgi:tetratricopeptide (TPR) repeat protein
MGTTTLVAAFGLEPVENGPTSAVLAAVAMLKAAERARRHDPRGPGVAVAIHVTPVMVGEVNAVVQIDVQDKHAARAALSVLLAESEQGSILVSEAAVPFLDRRFDLVLMGRLDGALGQFWRLALQEASGFRLGSRPLTQFVGRKPELAILGERLAQVKRARGQVVCVVGEPGVGKSRFVYELTRSDQVRGWRVLHGRTVPTGIATPWLPITDLLKRHFAVDDSDPSPQIREKVTAQLRARGLDSDGTALVALLDIPVDDPGWRTLDPRERRQRMVEGVKRVLLRESEHHPLLVILEDLHWGDSETHAFLGTLVDCLPTAAILLLVSYRPGFQHDWGSKTYYTQLRLDALSPENAGEMLQVLLGDDPALGELKGILIARTEGNPFLIEESIRSLVETGMLTGERGAFALTTATPTTEVPATVQTILAARIGRLPAAAKELLQSAAVIGKDVPFALLQAISDLPDDSLPQYLAHLRAGEFLYETRLFPDLEYTFKHALTHEVAYGSLLHERRRTLHARIVGALEVLHPESLVEHVERLGHHALRGEVWDKAVVYLRQAGAKAWARSAAREAVTWLEEALAALAHLPESRANLETGIDLRIDLRNALLHSAAIGRIREHLEEAERLAETLQDQRRLSQVASHTAWCCYMAGQYDRTVEAAGRALAIARGLGDIPLEVPANLYQGYGYQACGQLQQATESYARNVAVLGEDLVRERFGLAAPPSLLSRVWLAFCLAELGQFREAVAHAEEALLIATAVERPLGIAYASHGMGVVYLRKGDLTDAVRLLERARGLCRDWSLLVLLSVAAEELGAAYTLAGRVGDAVSVLEDSVRRLSDLGTFPWQTRAMASLGEAYLAAGRKDAAARTAGRTLELALERGEQGARAGAHRLLAEIAARVDPPDVTAAKHHYGQAQALAQALGMRPLVAHCQLGLGQLCRQAGKREQAQEYLATAATMYREMDMRFWLARAEDELARPARAGVFPA